MKKITLILSTALIFIASIQQKAFSCLSCSSTGAASVSDMDSLGSGLGVFSRENRFLIQLGTSFRDITGSFNETGKWYQKPSNSSIQSLTNNLRLNYFATSDLSFSLQLATISNMLDKASWGDFGSIAPTDNASLIGTSFGDMSLQTGYKVFDGMSFSLTPWININFPTGKAFGKPQEISGSGFYSTSLGLLVLSRYEKFEFVNSLSYQIPLNQKTETSTYSIGQSFFYQFSCNYDFLYNLKAGTSFYFTKGFWSTDNNANPVFNVKIAPSVQYSLDLEKGLKLSMVYSPNIYGTNTLTDNSLSLVYYNFIK